MGGGSCRCGGCPAIHRILFHRAHCCSRYRQLLTPMMSFHRSHSPLLHSPSWVALLSYASSVHRFGHFGRGGVRESSGFVAARFPHLCIYVLLLLTPGPACDASLSSEMRSTSTSSYWSSTQLRVSGFSILSSPIQSESWVPGEYVFPKPIACSDLTIDELLFFTLQYHASGNTASLRPSRQDGVQHGTDHSAVAFGCGNQEYTYDRSAAG